MKRSLTLLLASLLVVAGLSACGGNDKQDQSSSDSAVTGTGTTGNSNTGTDDGTTGSQSDSSNNQDSLMDDVEQGVDDAVQGTKDALDDVANDVTDGDRLDNARVHDRDGDLTDHENSTSRSAMR